MEARRHERGPERVHLRQRRHLARVAEVVRVAPAREARARGWFDRDDADLLAAAQLCPDERKRDAREVRPAAGAADDDVGVVVGHLHLRDRFLADDRLVQQHVVQHRTERVVGVRRRRRRPRPPRKSRCRGCRCCRACSASTCRPKLVSIDGLAMQRAPNVSMNARRYGFWLYGHPHHEHENLDAEERARERERRSPLPGAGLGRDLPDAGFLVVERLRDGRVGLVAARRTHALVLVIDARRRLQGLLETTRPIQRARAPLPVRRRGPVPECRSRARSRPPA